MRWWRRAMSEGKKLGARLEVARTKLEIGTRVLDDRRFLSRKSVHTFALSCVDEAVNVFNELALHDEASDAARVLKKLTHIG